MAETAGMIEKIMLVGVQADYDAIANHNPERLYFCEDTLNLYKGNSQYNASIRKVQTRPIIPAVNQIYHVTGTNTLDYYDGTSWHVIRLTPRTTITKDQASNDAIPTTKAVVDFVATELELFEDALTSVMDVRAGETAGTLLITKGGQDAPESVTMTGLVVNPEYDNTTRTITLPVAGREQPLIIALGKDIFLDTSKNNAYNTETKNIDLYLNDGTKIEIPAVGLIDIYTGKTDCVTCTVDVAEDNKISVEVRVSTNEGNALKIAEDGLYVDLSPVIETLTALDGRVKTLEDAFGWGTF